MQQTKKTAAESEPQRLRNFGLILQGCVVELQFFQRLAQRVVLVGFDWVEPGKHLRLDFLEAGQCSRGLAAHMRDGIANLGRPQFLDAGNDETDLPGRQRIAILRFRREHTDVLDRKLRTGRHQFDALFRLEGAVDDAHQHDDADVVIEP